MKGVKKWMRGALCAAFALAWALLLFLPFSSELAVQAEELYFCLWEDGASTEENYYSAYRDYVGVTDTGSLLIMRDGAYGEIAPSAAFTAAVCALDDGGLAEILAADAGSVTRLERAALYRRYRPRLWYADEFFAWTENAVGRTSVRAAEEVVLLAGSITASRLKATGATTLYVRAEAELTAASLIGSAIGTVVASSPYFSQGNAVCLSTAGGVRLIAGVPAATAVCVPEDVYFADEGALLPCTALEELELPFLGSAKSAAGSSYKGELAHLFSDGTEYYVPQTLRRVRVTGGSIVSHAFYRCAFVEEIDACGVAAEAIDEDAFADCAALRYLHTPRADVRLAGSYVSSVAPCGCTIYERLD